LLAVSLTACSSKKSAGPALARVDARPLVALANRISNERACAQRHDIHLLQQRVLALVNARRVPTGLQDTLMSGVNALAADTPPCVPSVPAPVQTTPAPPPAPAPPAHEHHEHPKPPKHGHDQHKEKH
jgi:hypothetical protein